MKTTPKTIIFQRYAPLTITAKDKLSKKEFQMVKKQLDKVPHVTLNKTTKRTINRLGDAAGKTIDFYTRQMLQSGTSKLVHDFGNSKVKVTRWDRIRWRIREIVSGIRVAIAEWIGGDDLHSNCGDY